jgi:two-component system response regulator FlrC
MKSENSEILTHDRNLMDLLQLSETVAKSKAAILIQGETGTGKRLLASWIHRKSQRLHKAIEIFECSKFSRGEQEAEFYNRLEAAHGGTLVLTEVSQLSPYLQTKLFQVLTDGVYLKPGTHQLMPVDVRVMATSTLPLSALVKSGDFREDLYLRLNVVNLKTPSLSDRMGDIEVLAKAFTSKWAAVHGRGEMTITSEAVQLLNGHTFSGNVRELDGTIERAVLTAVGNEIRARDIQIQKPVQSLAANVLAPSWKPGRTLDEIERNVILEALNYHSGNRTHTAKALGISIRTLRNKLAEYRVMGIQV